jgi:N-acetylglucosamine-6-phosphate deacetylase
VQTGFTDIHCHGGGGYSFSDPNPDHISTAIATHRFHGTTTQIASLVTAPIDLLKQQIRNLIPFVKTGDLAGIHLEGPYLAHSRCGAHDPNFLREPTIAEIQEILHVGDGYIRMITIAPELPGALTAIRECIKYGATVAIGHSEATFDEARAAIDIGASVVTHMFNALPPFDHKNANITNAVITNPDIFYEVILDGVHVNQSAFELLLNIAPDRIILVTDAMSAAGAPDGNYHIGSLDVIVEQGIATLTGTQKLAGSTLTMDSVFNRLTHEYRISADLMKNMTAGLGIKALHLEQTRDSDAFLG